MLLKDFMDTFSLKQHVVEASHKQGHVLDLVMTREEELEIWSIQNHGPVLSDHLPISFRIPCKLPSATQRTSTYRKLKDIDSERFSSDIDKSDLIINPVESLDELVSQSNNILSGLLNNMLPQSLSVYVHVSHYPGSQLRLKPKRPCTGKLKENGGNIDWQ